MGKKILERCDLITGVMTIIIEDDVEKAKLTNQRRKERGVLLLSDSHVYVRGRIFVPRHVGLTSTPMMAVA